MIALGVVSLLDVLKFAADDFWKASKLLAEWKDNPQAMVDPSRGAEAVATLAELLTHLRAINLPVSVREIEKLNEWTLSLAPDIESLPTFEQRKAELAKLTNGMSSRLERIDSIIHSELEARVIFALEVEKVEFWHPAWLVDTPIYSSFPAAWQEFRRAGRCYSFGEPTAAVFHLMRVIDSGLRLVYASLGEPYDSRNWDGIGKKIESEMTKRYQDKSADWRSSEPFYSAVLTDIRSISRAHRNPALHDIDRKYTESEAKYLIEVTKAFILHLAHNGMREVE